MNILHAVLVGSFAVALLGDSHNIPINIAFFYVFDKNWGITSQFIYCYETDNDYTAQTIGIAAGPRLSFDYFNGFFIDVKIGLAYTFGQDYSQDDYMRLDCYIDRYSCF